MKALNCPNCGAFRPQHAIKADLAFYEFCGSTFHISENLSSEAGMSALLLGTDFGRTKGIDRLARLLISTILQK